MGDPTIVVLGIGNTIMQDDGVGVRAVQAVAQNYDLPPRVRLIEGGVAGIRLLSHFNEAEHLLIVDAMNGEGPPGTIYRMCPEDLPKNRHPYMSAHEIGVLEILSLADFLGKLPRTRILGIQPLEAQTVGLDLTQPLQEALPRVANAIADELRFLGVQVKDREAID